MLQPQTIQLAPDLQICQILNGMWQVAGGHGQINQESAISEMLQYHESGLTTWDMADIYGSAEEFVGQFRKRLAKEKGEDELAKIQALTKFVPSPGPMTRSIVEYYIDKSIKRMNVKSILSIYLIHSLIFHLPFFSIFTYKQRFVTTKLSQKSKFLL